MYNYIILPVSRLWLFLSPLLAEEEEGFPWWLILLILALVIIIVIWALTRNASYSEAETPHVEHGHAHVEAHAQPAHVEIPPAVEPAFQPEVRAAVPVTPDDLEIVEGIGPKIPSLLKAAGIATFAQLAETDVQVLRDILLKANLRLGDPTSWPEQARLAAADDADGLKALQVSLKGGRKVS
jgi:predicted flap endonuclease-1-like 5' DNA nuclease